MNPSSPAHSRLPARRRRLWRRRLCRRALRPRLRSLSTPGPTRPCQPPQLILLLSIAARWQQEAVQARRRQRWWLKLTRHFRVMSARCLVGHRRRSVSRALRAQQRGRHSVLFRSAPTCERRFHLLNYSCGLINCNFCSLDVVPAAWVLDRLPQRIILAHIADHSSARCIYGKNS